MSTVSEPACYVIARRKDAILFVLRENTGFMDGDYCLPAGRVEAGETYAEGASREAMEEVGISVAVDGLRHVFTMHRHSAGQNPEERTDVFFEAENWSGEPTNAEPELHSEIAWLPIDDLPDNIMDYQRYALLEIMKGKTYGEFGWNLEKTD